MRFEIFAHNMQHHYYVTILYLLTGVIIFIVGILGLIAPYFNDDSEIKNFFDTGKSNIIYWIILLFGLGLIGLVLKAKIDDTE